MGARKWGLEVWVCGIIRHKFRILGVVIESAGEERGVDYGAAYKADCDGHGAEGARERNIGAFGRMGFRDGIQRHGLGEWLGL